MQTQLSLQSSPKIQPRTIRGLTIPNRAADCAVSIRKSVLEENRAPSVPELSNALGVSQPAVIQLEHLLQKREVLRGSHRKGNMKLAKALLIPRSALVALVASTLLHDYFDSELKARVYTDGEKGPWSEDTYIKSVRDKAKLFGFELEDLRDVPELVKAGYLQGKPSCFRLNKKLWDRDKLIFVKIFGNLKPGKIAHEAEEDDSAALFEALAKSVVLIPGNHDVELKELDCGLIEWIRAWQKAKKHLKTSIVHISDLKIGHPAKELLEDLPQQAYAHFVRDCRDRKISLTRYFFTHDPSPKYYRLSVMKSGDLSLEPVDKIEVDAVEKRLNKALHPIENTILLTMEGDLGQQQCVTGEKAGLSHKNRNCFNSANSANAKNSTIFGGTGIEKQ